MFIQKPFSLTTSTGTDAAYVPKGAIWLDGSADYLSWTPSGSGTSRTVFTFSLWVKRGNLDTAQVMIGAGPDGNNRNRIMFNPTTNIFAYEEVSGGLSKGQVETNNKFRDPTAWMHIYVMRNGTDPMTIQMNGVNVSKSYNTDPSTDAQWGYTVAQTIGRRSYDATQYFDGYLSEIIYLDGSARPVSDFAGEDSNGCWVPKDPTDSVTSYKGTNGYWLDFADSSDLGNDVSGNNNDFTANSMSASNWTYDRPADSGTDTGNQCTFNPIFKNNATNTPPTFSNGNLTATGVSGAKTAVTTIPIPTTGKWSCKTTKGALSGSYDWFNLMVSKASNFPQDSTNPQQGSDTLALVYSSAGGTVKIFEEGTEEVSITYWGTGTGNVEALVDRDANTIKWYMNGARIQDGGVDYTTSIPSDLQGEDCYFTFYVEQADISITMNYTASDTDYSVALGTQNLPAPTVTKPSDNFLPILYEGNGGGQRVGNFIPFTDAFAVDNSCVFLAGDSDGLTRTPGTATNLKKWTFSTWIKPGKESRGTLILAGDWNGDYTAIRIDSNLQLTFESYISSAWKGRIDLDRVMKQYDTWVHIFFRYDSTPASPDGDDVYLAINGVQSTNITSHASSPTYPSQNQETIMNTAVLHSIAAGGTNVPSADYYDGYMAETIMVDGYALSPSVFGQTDTSTNRWIPKEVTAATLNTAGGGSSGFGDEGFYLEFGTAADLGDDTSGETNDWTENNIAAANQTTDTPTKNFAVWNSLWSDVGGGTQTPTMSNGNRTTVLDNGEMLPPTIGVSSGKWYWEVEWDAGSYCGIGVMNSSALISGASGNPQDNTWILQNDGDWWVPNAGSAVSMTSYATSDILGFALDFDNNAIWISKNGTWMNSASTAEIEAGTTTNAVDTNFLYGQTMFPMAKCDGGSNATFILNTGQTTFNTAAPSGFSTLNQDNLDANTAGITGFSWIKNLDAADNHILQDRVRGIYEYIISNDSDDEATNTNSVQRFLQQGVQIGNMNAVNTQGESYVLWNWVANGTSNPSVNTDAGFSIATYTGNGTGGRTVTHSLGVVPEFICVKKLGNGDDSTNRHWAVYHVSEGNTKYGLLSDTNAFGTSSGYWNDTTPGTSTFAVGTDDSVNGNNAPYVAYCWASVDGYSKFGSYTGNANADGPYIYLGFKPAWILRKKVAAGSWTMTDFRRSPINPADEVLYANNTNAEYDGADTIDICSNGFKIRSADTGANPTSEVIYAAFAENPFGGSGIAQAKAR